MIPSVDWSLTDAMDSIVEAEARVHAAAEGVLRSNQIINAYLQGGPTAMSQMLTRDLILNANDIKRERVEVPEWGGHVFVQGLTGEERDSFEAAMVEGRGKNRDVNMRGMRARLCSLSIVNEHGERVFGSADIDFLATKSAKALQRCFDKAAELSGITNDEVESLAGNSETTTGEAG